MYGTYYYESECYEHCFGSTDSPGFAKNTVNFSDKTEIWRNEPNLIRIVKVEPKLETACTQYCR